MNHTRRPLKWAAPALSLLVGSGLLHATTGEIQPPDFTRGDPIPAGADHDWNLGATGARGWMFSDKLVTTDARQVRITQVEEGSPADRVLKVGDVILGVGGQAFSSDPREALGEALTAAESEAGGGELSLIRWRAGKTKQVVVKLPVLGTYSATAPYDCPKSRRILLQGCEVLAKRVVDPSYAPDPIVRSLNALALLASGDRAYLKIVRRETEWAADYAATSFQTWYYGYVMMLLSEYVVATGDESLLPGLERLALQAVYGQSLVGSWGHKFAGPDGRLGGYGMMNAPGVPLTISLVMAQAAGVRDAKVAEAVERSARLLRFYIGKGAVPYGDHHPWIETHEDNGKCGMSAVLFNLLEEPAGAQFFSRMSLASHGAERDCGHTGNFFNMLWAMPGVAQSGPDAAGAWMEEYGAWSFDLARRWDGSFLHQGPPEPKGDSYVGWDSTGAYLLAYAMPLKNLMLTGKRPPIAPRLDTDAARRLIEDGRGWDNKDRQSAYDQLDEGALLARLQSWSPVVRERAAMAVSRRGSAPISALVELLDAPAIEARLGACQALAQLKTKGAAAVPALRETLRADDLWLRIKAADALAAIGAPAMSAVPELLALLSQVDPKRDQRGMQQRYLTFALFNARGGLLGRSLEGVDREALYAAVRSGLLNDDGRARGSLSSVYRHLSVDEIKPLLPDILRAVVEPSPSGIMFADEIRVEGLKVLAAHKVLEGIEACAEYTRSQNPWASEKRTPELMKILLVYGAHAKSVVPKLSRIADDFADGEPDFPKQLSLQKAGSVRETIAAIEASTDYPALIHIE